MRHVAHVSLGILVALSPALAPAQRPLAVAVAGGVSVRERALAGGARAGWHASGALVLSGQMQPMGLRAEGAYNRFPLDDGGAHTVGSATLNVTYRLPSAGAPVAPYVVTGAGAYRTDCSALPGCASSTRFGWNAGLGARLHALGVRSFVEARYHRTTRPGAAVSYVPVTLGVMF